MLAPVLEANLRALRERDPASAGLRRYTQVARLLTGRDDATVEDAVTWLRHTVAALDVPPLTAVGLRPAQYAEVTEKAARSRSMQGNPVRLTEEELLTVLHAAS